MKTIRKLIIACLVVGLATTTYAQKIKVISGDLKFLKGAGKINVKYDYSSMKVGAYDEADYINKKVTEKNKAEAGTGDKWKEAWENDKITKFQPKFEELMNKYLKDSLTIAQDTSGTEYTVILKTTFLEPGYNVGVSSKPAYINVDIMFVANNAPTTYLCKMTMLKVPGTGAMGYDFDTGYRISEAYAKCGKSLAAYIFKTVYKS